MRAVVAAVVVLIVIGIASNNFKKKSAASPTTPTVTTPTTPAPTTAAPTTTAKTTVPATKTKPQFVLIVSQSSCQGNPSAAYVNCSIGVKNNGSAKGLPTVYADYRYRDNGESFDHSDNGTRPPSDPIPAHELGFVYFSHPYNAQQHDLVQVAVTLDENAKRWPYVRVASPDDTNWPQG